MDREGLMSQKIFFTADLHFGHKNIITMTKRKFGSIEKVEIKITIAKEGNITYDF